MKLMRFIAGTVVLVVGCGLGATPAFADEGLGFSVTPAPSDAPRDYLRLAGAAGDTVVDSLVVRNLSDRPLALDIAGVDASTGPLGGASYGTGDSPPHDVGAWISLSRSSLTLGPRSSATVDVQVRVPPSAGSGQHLGAVAVRPTESSPDVPVPAGGLDAGIRLTTRRVVAVLVIVPGPSEPELVVAGVAPAGRPSGLFLLVDLANRGGELTTAEGTLDVPSLGFHRSFNVDTFVPGTSIRYPVEWGADVPAGRFDARVELRYGSKVARWDGAVVVGSDVRAELDRRQMATPRAATPPPTPALPWGLLGGALALGTAAGFAVRRRPRTRVKGFEIE